MTDYNEPIEEVEPDSDTGIEAPSPEEPAEDITLEPGETVTITAPVEEEE